MSDTGAGIPDHHLPHIFEPYWKADARQKSSTGLGLSIARAIVEAHGGRIWVDTAEGSGSTFYFTLRASGDETGATALVQSPPLPRPAC